MVMIQVEAKKDPDDQINLASTPVFKSGGLMDRLGIRDLHEGTSDQRMSIWSEIDPSASDDFRQEKAIKNGLAPDASWEEITQTAQARAKKNLSLPSTANLKDIIAAREDLAFEIIREKVKGADFSSFDLDNPEVQFAIKMAGNMLVNHAGELFSMLKPEK